MCSTSSMVPVGECAGMARARAMLSMKPVVAAALPRYLRKRRRLNGVME